MTMELTVVLAETLVLAEVSSDSFGLFGAAIFLFMSGPAYYMLMYRRYRNKDQRHTHERETPATKSNIEQDDRFVRKMFGVSHTEMTGANNKAVHGSRLSKR